MSRSRTSRYRPLVEGMESRCLLSTTPVVNLAGGHLWVVGTDGPDQVVLTLQEAKTWGRFGGPARISGTLQINGGKTTRISSVSRVTIQTGSGDDQVTILTGNKALKLPIQIQTAEGNDILRGSPSAESLEAGPGDDQIFPGGGWDNLVRGTGNDRIDGAWFRDPPPAVDPAPPVTGPPPILKPPIIPLPPPADPAAAIVAEIISRTNAERAKAGLPALKVNAQLSQMANLHAQAMASLGRMEHTLDGAAYPTLLSRAQYVGYSFALLGENIAYNYPDAANVTLAWINSPGHRANILHADFTEIGVAVVYSKQGEPYYCQVFGDPWS